MTDDTAEAQQAALNGSLPETEGTAVLRDQDFLRLAPALDLSTGDWLRVFQAHSGPPSLRREIFQEALEQQLQWLGGGVYDDDPCPESMELAGRIEGLPRMLKLTVLDAVERFWSRESEGSSWDERLQNLGLRPCTSAHARLAALALRRSLLAEQGGPSNT